MTMKIVKRILATTLVATLMVAPVLTAGATTDSSSPASSSSSSDEQSTSNPFTAVASTSTVSVGGKAIKSQISGSYMLNGASIAGVAVRQGDDAIKAAAGLGKNEKPFMVAYDINAKKSPAAMKSINDAAAAYGATVLGAVNMDLGKMTNGKFSDLPAGVTVPVTLGVKNANGRTLKAVKVLPGGATQVLDDQDNDANTLTFDVTGGLAAYAVIGY